MLALSTLCGIIKMLFPLAVIILVAEFFNILNQTELPTDVRWHMMMNRLYYGVLLLVLFPIPTYVRRYLGGKVAGKVVLDLRYDLFLHIRNLANF